MLQRGIKLIDWLNEPLNADRPAGVPFKQWKKEAKLAHKQRRDEICLVMDCTWTHCKLYLRGVHPCPPLRGQAAANYLKTNVVIGGKTFLYYG